MDETNYNNGNAPQSGMVWSGEAWGWPTSGSWSGNNTLTVWPKNENHSNIQDFIDRITGNGNFDPVTGNGWVPEVDGVWLFTPENPRAETKNGLNKLKESFNTLSETLNSVDFSLLKIAAQEVGVFNTVNPVITMLSAQLMTDTKLTATSSAPASVKVHSRILDDVHDGRQYLSVVGSKENTYNVPVVMAKKFGKAYLAGRMPGPASFLEFYIYKQTNKEQRIDVLVDSTVKGTLRKTGAYVGERTDDYIVWFPKDANIAPLYVSFAHALTADGLAKRVTKEKKANDELQNAIKATTDFYKELTKRFGAQQSAIAKELADNAKGKRIRSADDALKSFNKYKSSVSKKYSAKDLQAISKALESVNRDMMARQLSTFSKGLSGVSYFIDGVSLVSEFNKSVKSGDWKPFFVKAEVLGAGMFASQLVAFTFAALTATPMGILGFSLIMFLTSALIDDKKMGELHDKLFK